MSEFEDFGGPINRPAHNARQATPGQMHSGVPAPDAGATDFLGLNQELGATPPAQPHAPAPQSATTMGADSWLLGLPEESQPQAMELPEPAHTPPASALLNTAWREEPAPRKSRRWLAPLAAGSTLAAVAMIGYPRLQRGAQPTAPEPRRPEVATAPQNAASEPEPLVVLARTPLGSEDEVAPAAAEPEFPAFADPLATAREPEPVEIESNASNSREELERAPRTALEDSGLVEVVDPAPAIRGECDEPTWWTPHEPASFERIEAELSAVADATELAPATPADAVDAAVEAADEAADEAGTTRAVAEPEPVARPKARARARARRIDQEQPALESAQTALAEEPLDVSSAEPQPAAPESTTAQPDPVAVAPVLEPAPEPVAVTPVVAPAPVAAARIQPAPAPAPAVQPAPAATLAPGFVGAPAPEGVGAPELPHVGPSIAPQVLAALEAGPGPEPVLASGNPRTTTLEVQDVLLVGRRGAGTRTATANELKGVWKDTAIPLDAISNKTKLLTPSVGRVRAVLHTGDIFEGSLYAVGEGCLWVDTSYGRMGLTGSRVRSVTRIDVPAGTPALGAPGSQELAGLERVRVRTPGGTLMGKLVERTGSTATVVTDGGARLTLDSKDVELATEAPSIQVRPKQKP